MEGVNERGVFSSMSLREAARLSGFALLIIGTLGLLINEFVLDWGRTATVTFAAVNVMGFAILGLTLWASRRNHKA